MIRDRLKKTARKLALKAFGMEKDAEDRRPTRSEVRPGDTGDIGRYIPRVVDGDGDTPGPNDKRLIGRTWLSAQVVSGVPGLLLDVRPPGEYAQGHLPGAVLAPGWQIRDRPALLPDPATRITVYDAADEGLAREVARWLRQEGWTMARGLQGGWAEWLEHGEPAERPEPLPGGRQIGDPVALPDGRRGVLQGAAEGGLEVLTEAGGAPLIVPGDELG